MRDDIRRIFSRNLNTILDLRKHPPAGYGRVSRLAELFGMSLPSAQKWLNEGALPDPSRYDELRDKLGCTLDALFTVDGPLGVIESNQIRITTIVGASSYHFSIPAKLAESLRWNDGAMLLRVSDNAMEPFVVPGDYVTFDPTLIKYAGDGPYVVFFCGGYSTRRIGQLQTGHMRLTSSETRITHFEDVPLENIGFGLPPTPVDDKLYLVGPILSRILVHR